MRYVLVAVVVVAAVSAAIAAAEHGTNAAPPARSDVVVVSRHVRPGEATLVTGALAAAPSWGVALLVRAPPLRRPPVLVATDTQTGSLRIVHSGQRSYLLRSAGGWLYSLELRGENADPTLYTFGPRLDPARLPELSPRGAVIPVPLGESPGRSAVLLVGLDQWLTPHLYGYLPGFALPAPATPRERLGRPLLGPDGALYRVDVGARRLVRVSEPGRARPWRADAAPPPRGCTSWPAGDLGAYRACPGSIAFVARDGRQTVVERDADCTPKCRDRNWESVLPSPDGRTLLVQRGIYACGGAWTTYFLPATGGTLQRTIPQFGFSSSWSIGWVDGDRALVAADGVAECSEPTSGLYAVDRRSPGVPPQVVALAPSHDATLWPAETVRTRPASTPAASSAAPAG